LDLTALQWVELLAVALAVTYLLLAIRQNIWCWAAAAVSTLLYLVIMYRASLYMESVLQLFYLGMAFYGWQQWRRGGKDHGELAVSTWAARRHVLAVSCVLLLVLVSGALLQRFTEAALPFADSLTTWGAVVATYMVARKILENWIYWFVIDSVSVYLYLSRELYFTAALFVAYLVMIVFGYLSWRRSMREAIA